MGEIELVVQADGFTSALENKCNHLGHRLERNHPLHGLIDNLGVQLYLAFGDPDFIAPYMANVKRRDRNALVFDFPMEYSLDFSLDALEGEISLRTYHYFARVGPLTMGFANSVEDSFNNGSLKKAQAFLDSMVARIFGTDLVVAAKAEVANHQYPGRLDIEGFSAYLIQLSHHCAADLRGVEVGFSGGRQDPIPNVPRRIVKRLAFAAEVGAYL